MPLPQGLLEHKPGKSIKKKLDSKNIENIKVYRGYNRNNEIIFWKNLRIRQKQNICEYCELNFLTTLYYKLTVSKSGQEIIKSCESVKIKKLYMVRLKSSTWFNSKNKTKSLNVLHELYLYDLLHSIFLIFQFFKRLFNFFYFFFDLTCCNS